MASASASHTLWLTLLTSPSCLESWLTVSSHSVIAIIFTLSLLQGPNSRIPFIQLDRVSSHVLQFPPPKSQCYPLLRCSAGLMLSLFPQMTFKHWATFWLVSEVLSKLPNMYETGTFSESARSLSHWFLNKTLYQAQLHSANITFLLLQVLLTFPTQFNVKSSPFCLPDCKEFFIITAAMCS